MRGTAAAMLPALFLKETQFPKFWEKYEGVLMAHFRKVEDKKGFVRMAIKTRVRGTKEPGPAYYQVGPPNGPLSWYQIHDWYIERGSLWRQRIGDPRAYTVGGDAVLHDWHAF